MATKPKSHAAPKTFDVFKPGKTRPPATSRPIIVGHRPEVQDPTVVEKPGKQVANARDIPAREEPKPEKSVVIAAVPAPTKITVPETPLQEEPNPVKDSEEEIPPASAPVDTPLAPKAVRIQVDTDTVESAAPVQMPTPTPAPEETTETLALAEDKPLEDEETQPVSAVPPESTVADTARQSVEPVTPVETPAVQPPMPDTAHIVVSNHRVKHSHTESIRFFTLFLVFVLLATVVVLLFMSGSLSLKL